MSPRRPVSSLVLGCLAFVFFFATTPIGVVQAQGAEGVTPGPVDTTERATLLKPAAAAPHRAESGLEAPAASAEASVEPAPAPRRLRRLKRAEIDVPHMLAARDVIRRHNREPFGTEVDVEVDGVLYVARIERHYHPEGGAAKPWGYHPGASLFAIEARVLGPSAPGK